MQHPFSDSSMPQQKVWDYTVSKKVQLDYGGSGRLQKVVVDMDGNEIKHLAFRYCYDSNKIQQMICCLPDTADRFPDMYVTEKVANKLGYYYVPENGGDWLHVDDINFGNRPTENYHSGQTKDLTSHDDKWMFGIEVEKVDNCRKNSSVAREIRITTGWRKEEDGSLGCDGYELISPILPMHDDNVIMDALSNDSIKYLLDAEHNDNCGGHFTVSHKDLSSREVLQRIKFFAPIIYAMYANRTDNRFCKAQKWQHYFRCRDKYQAFFLKSDKLLEIRIPSAYANVKQIKWRIGFMRVILSEAYSGHGYLSIVKKMLDGKSVLSRHMLQVYSMESLLKMLLRSVMYAKQLMPFSAKNIAKVEEIIRQELEAQESISNA